MPIEETQRDAFKNWMQQKVDNRVKAIILRMEWLGNKCLREARENRKYTDQTGNLRSSTGYAVVVNGQVVRRSNFTKVGKAAKDAKLQGSEFLDSLVTQCDSHSIYLILVAGMNYAIYVENMGLNVLDSAIKLAKSEYPNIMQKLGFVKK